MMKAWEMMEMIQKCEYVIYFSVFLYFVLTELFH